MYTEQTCTPSDWERRGKIEPESSSALRDIKKKKEKKRLFIADLGGGVGGGGVFPLWDQR